MIKTSPFLEFQIDRSLFRMKGGIWEEFYHFCDHQLIKTDEIVGHREVLDALGGQFIQTPSSMLRRPRFHEIFFICFNQQRFFGLKQRYEVSFFSLAINT